MKKGLTFIIMAVFLLGFMGTGFAQNLNDMEVEEVLKQRVLKENADSSSDDVNIEELLNTLKGNEKERSSAWFSTNPSDLQPLAGTTWQFTFTITSTFTDTITFGTSIETTSDGSVALSCYSDYGDGYAYYTDLPYSAGGGQGFAVGIDTSSMIEFYYFKVSGCSASGAYSSNISSNYYSMTGKKTYPSCITTPSAPTGVSATDGTYTDKVRVTWYTSSGASYYRVYRGTSSSSSYATALGSWQTSTTYDDTSAVAGTTYYYWVKAATSSSGTNASGFSSSNTGYRKKVVIPSAPAGVSATDGTYTDKVSVTWYSSSGASYYRVYRGTGSSSSYATALGSWQTSTTYYDYSATAGTTYYYWVKAATSSSGANASGFSSYNTGYRKKVVIPSAPSGVSATDGTYTDKVSVTWYSSSGASYYRVYRGTGSSSSYATALGSWQTSTTYYDYSATAGTTYYYWVKAATSSSGANASGFGSYNTGYAKTGGTFTVENDYYLTQEIYLDNVYKGTVSAYQTKTWSITAGYHTVAVCDPGGVNCSYFYDVEPGDVLRVY